MAQCQPFPTQTVYSTFLSTSEAVGTSTSLQVVTAPPSTQTSFSTVCLQSASGGLCQSSSVQTIVTTVPGGATTSTVLVPFTNDVVVTESTPVQTLFGSSCASGITTTPTSTPDTPTSSSDPINTPTSQNQQTSTTPNNDETSSTPQADSTSPTKTQAGSQTLGTPSVFTSVVTLTASNGQVVTSASVGTTTPTLIGGSESSTSGKSSSNAGLIAGSVIAGFAGVGILAAIVWFLWRRRGSRWDDIFDKEEGYEEPPRRNLNLLDGEPKPYEYGMVGAAAAPAGEPQSPSTDSTAYHNRTPSMAPLLLPPGSATTSFDMSHSSSPQGSPNMSPPNITTRQSNQTLNSAYFGYPPQQSPPFLPTNQGAPPKQRPSSMTATSRNPSHASNLSGNWTPPREASSSQGSHVQQSSGTSSAISPNMTSDTSAAPSFVVQRKGRPQSYGAVPSVTQPATSSSSSPPAPSHQPPLAPLQTDLLSPQREERQYPRGEKAPPPTYEAATSPARGSEGSTDNYLNMSLHGGARLAVANPDAGPLSPDTAPGRPR